MLFKLPRASVCKHMKRAQDKAGQEIVAARTITSPRTIVYVLTMIRVEVHEAERDNKTRYESGHLLTQSAGIGSDWAITTNVGA